MYLAIDIGASGGRHILGSIADGQLVLEEIHRFKNGMVSKGDSLCWDIDALFEEILTGLAKCKTLGKIPKSVGIDTWGVDFVLLDENDNPLSNAVAYRDSRTIGMDDILTKYISETELYAKTGIAKHLFNTIYQFLSLKESSPELLSRAKGFLLMPEYFSFMLSGVKKHEYTNATTTSMVDAQSKTWDFDLIKKIGLPADIFGEIAEPSTKLGGLLPHIQERVGFNCDVILPCTHDTASAVVSAPVDDSAIYLSSGTWSLMGTELLSPICTEDSRLAGITNEGGYGYRYRFLKNIMGLWIIQNIKSELDDEYSYTQLCEEAAKHQDFPSRINVNDHAFMAPASMIDAIKTACADTGQQVPEAVGELTFCVYQSLADSYAQTVNELETLTGKKFNKICIIGGGNQNIFLNELTAKACNKTVTTGPTEATAAGNILVQMISAKQLSGIEDARKLTSHI